MGRDGQRPRRIGGAQIEEPTYQPHITQRAHDLNRSEYDGQTVYERLYLAPGAGRRAEPDSDDEQQRASEAGTPSEEQEKKTKRDERRARLAAKSRQRQQVHQDADLWERLHAYGELDRKERVAQEILPYQPTITPYFGITDAKAQGDIHERLY